MPFNIRYEHSPAMAVAEISGLAFPEQAEEAVLAVQARTFENGDRRLLIDLTDVVGTLGPADHQALGLLAVRYLSHLERVASLVPADKITRVSETAAQAQGLPLKVFTELGVAVAWLLEPPP